MTDVSRLQPLAEAISTSSSRIRAWALEQTRVTLEQETRLRKLEPAAPAPPLAPPREPITYLTDRPTVSLNVYGPGAVTKFSDYVITRGGETAVMVLPEAPATKLSRIRCVDVAAGWNSTMARPHALYGKSPYLTVEDIWAKTAKVDGDCYSLRMAGAVLRRFHGEGTHAHLIGYFEEKQLNGTTLVGDVLIEDGTGTFNIQTAIWISTNSAPECLQRFTIRRVHVTGPGEFFVRVDLPTFKGSVVIEDCTLNGKPVAAAMTNLPADKLTIR